MTASKICWFVGATYHRNQDQTGRFLKEGIWEVHTPTVNEAALVRSMKPGERIAIKSTYVRKNGLNFDNHGHSVSVMAIKATGIIRSNSGDGERVLVDWEPVKQEPATIPREWYFYTFRATIWRVEPGRRTTDGLIQFAFHGASQDISHFRNLPYWRERFGDQNQPDQRFAWTRFYEAFADKLLQYQHDREPLVAKLKLMAQSIPALGYLAMDKYSQNDTGFVRDICPFTVIGTFNRGITTINRQIIARELAQFLGVSEAVPDTFDGIPLLNNMRSWFFPYEVNRDSTHIDALWTVFAAAIHLAGLADDVPVAEGSQEFATAFDDANGRDGVAWNLTMGLYWIRPWHFPSLDQNSQNYITKKLGVLIGHHGPKHRCNSEDYLSLLTLLDNRFEEADYPVHNYPELSLAAWQWNDPTKTSLQEIGEVNTNTQPDTPVDELPETTVISAPIVPYTVDDILLDGCFLDRAQLEKMLATLERKKNLILQGPPGTGKTWLAKRLAMALIKRKDEGRIRVVQFHPNLSYEDFVRGWRPVIAANGSGQLKIADGVFMEAITAASQNTSTNFVVIIEEFNRGNPAQIFGELLTLLEASKRNPNDALELCYPDADGSRQAVHIPDNLYIIGTMNIADRSLALVDMALRRRFAFVELAPCLNQAWREWMKKERGFTSQMLEKIYARITELNQKIERDPRLGKQFLVGHSFVTPTESILEDEQGNWFLQVIETELEPLLEEYWYDKPTEARKAAERLMED